MWSSIVLVTTILAVLLGVLTQLEMEKDILLCEKTVALPATRPTVFRFVSDLSNYAKWFPGVDSFEAVDSASLGIGKHYREVQEAPIIGSLTYDNVMISYESPRMVGFLSDAWLGLRVEMEMSRRDSKQYPSDLTWKMYSRRRSFLVQYLIGPVVGFAYTQRVRQGLFNLRYEFERH